MFYPCLHERHFKQKFRSAVMSQIKSCFDNNICRFVCSVRSFIAESWLCASSRAAQLCDLCGHTPNIWGLVSTFATSCQHQGLATPSSWASVPDFSESLGRCGRLKSMAVRSACQGHVTWIWQVTMARNDPVSGWVFNPELKTCQCTKGGTKI